MDRKLTDYHKYRYEWAFSAQKEFIHSFVILNVQETNRSYSKKILNGNKNDLSFGHLTELYKIAEKTRKRGLEEFEKEKERLDLLIKRQHFQIDIELKETYRKEKQFLIESRNLKGFLQHIEQLIKDIKAIETEHIVNELIPYHSSHKKASILNSYASKLQVLVENRINKQIKEIKEKAQPRKIFSVDLLQFPELDSIPKIHQKIDFFWLNSSYEKSLNTIRGHARDWLVKINEAFMNLLTPILSEGKQKIHRLAEENEALKRVKEETLHKLQQALTVNKEKRDLLTEQQNEWNKLWHQDCEHAKRLTGYFIKHWLLYKEELEHQFIHVPVEERWLVSQYILLLRQDGERIIESMNIGDE